VAQLPQRGELRAPPNPNPIVSKIMNTIFDIHKTNVFDKGYNGWTNYETWNVALWLQNDEGLYALAGELGNYEDVVEALYECGVKETPDGVKYNSKKVNTIELNSEVFDF